MVTKSEWKKKAEYYQKRAEALEECLDLLQRYFNVVDQILRMYIVAKDAHKTVEKYFTEDNQDEVP